MAAKTAAAAAPALGFGAAGGSSKPPLAPFSLGSAAGSSQAGVPAFAALPSTGAAFNFSAAPVTTGAHLHKHVGCQAPAPERPSAVHALARGHARRRPEEG